MKEIKNEIWKNIPGYNSHYFVSNAGRVKKVIDLTIGEGVDGNEAIIGSLNKAGRPIASIVNDNGVRKLVLVSRLVALAFIPNPNGYKYVRHYGEDLKDVRAENLFWTDDLSGNYNVVHSQGEREQFLTDLKEMVREDFCEKYGLGVMAYYAAYRKNFGRCEASNTKFHNDTKARINSIINDINNGVKYAEICAKYNVTMTNVSKIKARYIVGDKGER